VAGSPWAFLVASLVVLLWALTGPLFHFSDSWQLVINTGTTIATFLTVFLIQNAQNRDAKAPQARRADPWRQGRADVPRRPGEPIGPRTQPAP